MIRKTRLLFWFLALAMIMACAPVLSSAPVVPTIDSDAVNRVIAQTAQAASTQTAVALPTSTPTSTSTFRPRGTNTPQPTATETFVFVYNTPTAFVIPVLTSTFSPTSNKDYACDVLNSPMDNEIYSPRFQFKARWRLRNVGRKVWDRDSVDFVYDYGDKFYKTASYNLSKTTEVGYVAEFFVELEAPKDPGTYTAHWALKVGTEKFCKVSLTIGVKE